MRLAELLFSSLPAQACFIGLVIPPFDFPLKDFALLGLISKDVKRDLQLTIAHKKVGNAAAYQEEARVAVERKEYQEIGRTFGYAGGEYFCLRAHASAH